MTKNILLMELAKLKKTIMDFRKSRVIMYDPERGELQVEVSLIVNKTNNLHIFNLGFSAKFYESNSKVYIHVAGPEL